MFALLAAARRGGAQERLATQLMGYLGGTVRGRARRTRVLLVWCAHPDTHFGGRVTTA